MSANINEIHQLPWQKSWHLAWPMILSNLSIPLMGLADTAMLGHLEDPIHLAAVALGSNLITMAFWMFSFLRMGTTGVTARAEGGGELSKILDRLTQSLSLALALGGILILGLWLATPWILTLMSPDESLRALALEYCRLRLWSAPAVLATFVISGWLLGLAKPRWALAITISANLLNIALDYLFIVVLDWGAKGAASATLIAEHLAFGIGLVAVVRTLAERGLPWHFQLRFSGLGKLLAVNRDLFIRTLILLAVFNLFNAQSAHLGASVLAANAILFQGMLFVAFFVDGYALASETLCGQALGAGKLRAFYQAVAATSACAAAIAIFLSTAFWLSGESLLPLFTQHADINAEALAHLPWLAALPVVSFLSYSLDGVFIGAGRTQVMRDSMAIAAIVGFIGVGFATRSWGNAGLWTALLAFNGLRSVGLGFAFIVVSQRARWLDNMDN